MTPETEPGSNRRAFLRLCGLAWLSSQTDFLRGTKDPKSSPPTFESFVVGPHNQEAFAAAWAVAQQPANFYNPLFIHSAAGMGKTHLLLALGQHVATTKPQFRVLYLLATHFAYLVDKARVGACAASRFREQFRQADVILLDDVHHLADETAGDFTPPDQPRRFNGAAAQVALHELFDEMYATLSKQFVFAAACEPDAIPHLNHHLAPRLQWGLMSKISMPHY